MLYKFLSVFVGSGLGAILRFIASEFSKKYFLTSIFGTFFVNIIGCFLAGFVFGYILNKTEFFPETLKIFIVVGFLGGLTTFSSFNFEAFELLKSGKIVASFLYLFSSCALGLLLVYLGYIISKL